MVARLYFSPQVELRIMLEKLEAGTTHQIKATNWNGLKGSMHKQAGSKRLL